MTFRRGFLRMLAIELGDYLRSLRKREGLSQEQMAVAMESHRPVISRIERGGHVPTLAMAILYAEICGASALDVARVIDSVIARYVDPQPITAPRARTPRPAARRSTLGASSPTAG